MHLCPEERWGLVVVGALAVLLGAFIAFPFVDMAIGETRSHRVVVIERAYEPSRISGGSGVGPTIGANGGGGVTVVSTTSYTPESYTLVVRGEDGEVFSRDVEPEVYAAAKPGDAISLDIPHGGITGWRW
jgi:hypothetical protein